MISLPRKKMKKRIKHADSKYTGDEPEALVIENADDIALVKAYAWYNYYYDSEKSKPEFLDFIKKHHIEKYPTFKSAPIYKFEPTMCITAKLLSSGWKLPNVVVDNFNNKLIQTTNALLKQDQDKKTKETLDAPRKSEINRYKRYYDIVDFEIDEFTWNNKTNFSMYNLLASNNPSTVAISGLADYCKALLQEILDKEGYQDLHVSKYKSWVSWYTALVKDIEKYEQNKKIIKSPRKPRTKKAIPTDKLIANLQYLKEYIPLKLASIDPRQIIGASQLWVYDTKYRTLTVLNSLDGGLTIKGTSVINVDDTKSISKRLRKPEEKLSELLNAGKVSLRTFMEQIKTTDIKSTNRITKDKILLRIIK